MDDLYVECIVLDNNFITEY